MNVFKENCPYCGTKSVAFTILHETLWSKGSSHAGPQRCLWDAFSRCGQCERGVVATFETKNENPPRSQGHDRVRLLKIAPSVPNTGAPNHTPENVARFFEQAMDNLAHNWDAAGGMFRKALDTGLRNKFPKMEGNLKTRIGEAANQQELTRDLAVWSHQIRLGGNEAMHEEDPFSEEEAQNLRDFTFLVFQYLFTLPGMLRKAGGNPDAAKANEG